MVKSLKRSNVGVKEAGPSQGKKVKAEGVERGGPGLDYQVQLLMFFARQGYELSQQKQKEQKGYLFELGKEWKEAGKFDDIIVRYKQEQDQAWNYLLLQAKYSQGQDKITTGKLLSDDSTAPFTLLKYFSSYIESKKQCQLDNTKEKIESCVIVTNTDFMYDDEITLKLKPAKARSGERGTGPRGKTFSLKKLESDDANEILRLTVPQAKGVKYYKFAVAEDIVEELEKEFKKSLKAIQRKQRKKDTDLDIIKNLEDIVANQNQESESESKFAKDLKEFLDTLLFIVNLPDRNELREITKEKIGEELCLLDDNIVDQFNRRMFDYTVTSEQDFFKGSDIERLFLKMKQNINDLILRPSYYLKVQNSKINFIDQEVIKSSFNDFLDAKSKEKIFTLKTESMFLSAVKVDKILKELSLKQYSYKNKHTFLNLKELFEINNLQDRIMESFHNGDDCNLLIIVFDSLNINNGMHDFQNRLYKIVRENNAKKVVLITEQNFELDWSAINVNEEHLKQNADDGNNFSNLTEDAKRDLLDTYVTFQGKSISLKELYFKLEVNKVPSSEQLNKLNIDAKTLESFSKDSIRIEKPFSVSDLEGAYSKFYEKVNANVLIERLEESSDKFFIISGINDLNKRDTLIEILKANSKKQRLGIIQDQICELNFRSGKLYTQHIKKIILADSEFKEENFKQFCHNHPDKMFYWINWKDNNFILRTLYYPKFLGRIFKCPANSFIDVDRIRIESFENNDDNLFFFTGVKGENILEKLSEVLQLQDQQEKEKLRDRYNSEKIIIQEKDDKSKFNQLVKENKSVYWLHVENKKITCRDVARKPVEQEKLIKDIRDESSILIDKPGMGKSTTLTILSEKMLKSHWVILITLRDWQKTIENLPEDINNDVAVKFLSDTKNLNTLLEKNLAKYILDKDNKNGVKLLLLFDGFDEIRSYDTENVGKAKFEKLIKFLKEKTPCTIWITAREHDANRLKNTLSTFDIKFEPLKKEQQEEYFKDIWSHSLALSVSKDKLDPSFSNGDGKFKRYYAELSNAAGEILAEKDSSFMGIPLTLRLFAESFRNKFQKFIASDEANDESFKKDFDNFDILKLYQDFIEAKFRIFFSEKTNLSSGFTKILEGWFKTSINKMHYRLAFQELFGAEETKKSLGIKKPFEGKDVNVNSEALEELLSFGMIRSTQKDRFEFLHRTFAEYFVSEMFIYMLENKERNNLQKYNQIVTFLKRNILKESNAVIYKFLGARSKKDQAVNDKWKLIICSDKEVEDLLGFQASNTKNSFEINTIIEDDIEADIEDLKEKVKRGVMWKEDDTFNYYGDVAVVNITNLVKKCLIETDSDKLKSTLEFLIPLFGKSNFMKFNAALSEESIIGIIDHYILRAELQYKSDIIQFVNDCFSKSEIIKNNEKYKELIKKEFNLDVQDETFSEVDGLFSKKDSQWLKDQGTAFIKRSRFLTHKIAETFNTGLNDYISFYRLYVFNNIISPLLSLKYFSKYDPRLFRTQIDTFALVNMFQAFAGEGAENEDLPLSQRSLEGLLECIRYLVHPDNISSGSLSISIKSLIALKDWNFCLTYKDDSLCLNHNAEEYSILLKFACEETIAKLFLLRLKNPSFDFEQECVDAANKILEARA